jgi:hypothetical protein
MTSVKSTIILATILLCTGTSALAHGGGHGGGHGSGSTGNSSLTGTGVGSNSHSTVNPVDFANLNPVQGTVIVKGGTGSSPENTPATMATMQGLPDADTARGTYIDYLFAEENLRAQNATATDYAQIERFYAMQSQR